MLFDHSRKIQLAMVVLTPATDATPDDPVLVNRRGYFLEPPSNPCSASCSYIITIDLGFGGNNVATSNT